MIYKDLISKVTRFKLQFSSRLVLCKLLELANDAGEVQLSYAELADLTNVSRVTAKRAIKQLVSLGYVRFLVTHKTERRHYAINAGFINHNASELARYDKIA